jgi:hypothetical protein
MTVSLFPVPRWRYGKMPVVSKEWVPFFSALAGGIFALGGAFLAQWMTKAREFRLDAMRAARVRQDKLEDANRKLFSELAEYAQHFDSTLNWWQEDYAKSSAGASPELVHRDLLTARLRTLNYPLVSRAWSALMRADDYLRSHVDYGNFDHSPHTNVAYIKADEWFMIGGHVAVEAVMLTVTAALGPPEFVPLFGHTGDSIAQDARRVFDDVGGDLISAADAAERLKAMHHLAVLLAGTSADEPASIAPLVTDYLNRATKRTGPTE